MKILLLVTFAFFSTNVSAAPNSSEKIIEVLKLYKKGDYSGTITELKKLEKTKSLRGKSLYWQGLCYTRLQEFDLANKFFARAVQYKKQPKDLFYEFGQSLFAANELKKSEILFRKSYKEKYRPHRSLYYVGYLNQNMKKYPLATKYYRALEKNSKADTSIKQAASMQIGEIGVLEAKKHKNPKLQIKNYVIPQFEKALELASNSSVSADIRKRIYELKKEYALDGIKMINGRKLREKPYKLRFNQTFSYDDNVTQEADEANETSTDKDSMINKTKFRGSYRFVPNNRFSLTPGLDISNTDYLDSENSDIYTNDAYSFTGEVVVRYEHTLFGKMSTLELLPDYAYNGRDHNLDQNIEFFSRSYSVSLSEKMNIFGKTKFLNFGDTTFKLKYKDQTNYLPEDDQVVYTANINQLILLPKGQILIATLNADVTDVNDSADSTNAYLLRFDWIGPKWVWGTKVKSSLAYTMTDTKKQKPTRGTEHQISPSLELKKRFKNWFETSLKYTYTNKTSKDKTSFDYQKHEVALDFDLSF